MFTAVCHIVMLMLAVALIAAFVRTVKGPSLPDRVVALDVAGTVVAALILTRSAQTGSAHYLPVAMCIALLSFLGTVALALYIHAGGAQQ